MPKYDSMRKIERNNNLLMFIHDHPDWSQKEVAEKFGISQPRVSQIVKREYIREEPVDDRLGDDIF